MFDQLFTCPATIARHTAAPYTEQRIQYLSYCQQRGDAPTVVVTKANDLLWIARKLTVYPDLHLTIEQIKAAVVDAGDPQGSGRRNLDSPHTRKRLICMTSTILAGRRQLCWPVKRDVITYSDDA